MDADELRKELRALGNRRAQAMQDARLGPEARKLVARGKALRVPVIEMAAELGVSRRAVYDLLAEQEGAAE